MPGIYPENQLIQYHTGWWGFVGKVDAQLAFEPGTERTRAWPTREDALNAANLIGAKVDHQSWDDANGAPRAIPTPATDATSLKRFFKAHFGIAVRVTTGKGKGQWINVWIPSLKRERGTPYTDPIRYPARFPDRMGNACMGIVYATSEKLRAQNWGGNISAHSISMRKSEWETFLAMPPESIGATIV